MDNNFHLGNFTGGGGDKEFKSSQNVLSLLVVEFSDLKLFSLHSRLVDYIKKARSSMYLYEYIY